MIPMSHLLLVLAALLLAATSACLVHDSGRGTTPGTSTFEVAPDVARGAATLGGVALFLGFMYLQGN
jgi:hypothetical protein